MQATCEIGARSFSFIKKDDGWLKKSCCSYLNEIVHGEKLMLDAPSTVKDDEIPRSNCDNCPIVMNDAMAYLELLLCTLALLLESWVHPDH